jgi:hypothetical protein
MCASKIERMRSVGDGVAVGVGDAVGLGLAEAVASDTLGVGEATAPGEAQAVARRTTARSRTSISSVSP